MKGGNRMKGGDRVNSGDRVDGGDGGEPRTANHEPRGKALIALE